MTPLPTALACAAGLALASCAAAQTAPAWQTDALEAAAAALEEGYIYPEQGDSLAARLREDADRFADIENRREFAGAVTADLFAIANDRRLNLIFNPDGDAEPAAPDEAAEAARAERIRFCRETPLTAERLEGGAGYILLPRFMGEDSFLEAFDAAMEDFTDAPAIILDVRGSCGGGPRFVIHISSYFFDEPTHLTSTESRNYGSGERWTLEEVPGPRFTGRPLIILTDRHTFSAAESFTFGLRAAGRVTIVGEATGGGRHWGNIQRLTDDFTLFVPQGRTFDPRTGEGWEAEGITPDVETSSEDALQAALDWLEG
jgi:hypothetical protein